MRDASVKGECTAVTEHAKREEARLQAEAASWAAPTDLEQIPWATEADIPVIDLGPYFTTGTHDSLAVVASALRAAALLTGFHYIINHGVEENLVEETLAAAAAFFDLPEHDKAALAMDAPPAHDREVRAGCGYLRKENTKLPKVGHGSGLMSATVLFKVPCSCQPVQKHAPSQLTCKACEQ